jgi:hypothetical protein
VTIAETDKSGAIVCPFMRAVTADQPAACPGGYHCALRRGGLRVPSGDEVAWFCTSGHFRACPTYRAWLKTARGGESWPRTA